MFRAAIDGKALTFNVDGLRGMNLILRDRETGTRWQQANGEAFEGPLQGKRLALVPFVITTWGEWRAQHPQTLALVPDPRFRDEYQRMAERLRQPPGGPFVRNALRQDARLPAHEKIIGLEAAGAHKAYPLESLRKRSVINDAVGSTAVVLIDQPETDTITAFVRRVNDHLLTFKAADRDARKLVDAETNSQWTAYGECVAGPLKGAKLEQLVVFPSFWFSWSEFFTDTQIYSYKGG